MHVSEAGVHGWCQGHDGRAGCAHGQRQFKRCAGTCLPAAMTFPATACAGVVRKLHHTSGDVIQVGPGLSWLHWIASSRLPVLVCRHWMVSSCLSGGTERGAAQRIPGILPTTSAALHPPSAAPHLPHTDRR